MGLASEILDNYYGRIAAARERNQLPILPVAPIRDCPNCLYRTERWRDGGFCYYFIDEPCSERCRQFFKWTEDDPK